MEDMFPAQPLSPITELASGITDSQTTIPLVDASVLPDAPNLATIGTEEDAECIKYEGKNGNDLTDVTRGFEGIAKAWDAGEQVARMLAAHDINSLQNNLEAHKAESAIHKTSDVIRTETETKLKVEVVSSSVSETPDAGRIIFDTSQGKFFGGNGTEWV